MHDIDGSGGGGCKPRANLMQTSCKPHADLVQTSCKPRANLVQTSCCRQWVSRECKPFENQELAPLPRLGNPGSATDYYIWNKICLIHFDDFFSGLCLNFVLKSYDI